MRCLALSLALLGAAAPARAQGAAPEAAQDAAKEQARALLREGNQRLAAGEFAAALEKFRAAYAAYASAKILVNIGTALRSLGQEAEAAVVYERCLREGAGDLDGSQRLEVAKAIDELTERLGRLAVSVNEADATVLVDETAVGTSPLAAPVWVRPGAHRVEARKEGFHPTWQTVQAEAGRLHEVGLLLAKAIQDAPREPLPAHEPPPAPAAPAPAPRAALPPVAAAPARVARARPAPPRTRLGHAGQLGAVARFTVDYELDGGAAEVGATLGVNDRFELGLAAILGSAPGARVAVTIFLAPHEAWKPFAAIGAPLLAVDGARLGVHAGGGVQVDATERMGAFVEAAVEHFPTIPEPVVRTAFVPSIGVQARW